MAPSAGRARFGPWGDYRWERRCRASSEKHLAVPACPQRRRRWLLDYIFNVSMGCSKVTFSACLIGNFLMSGGPKYLRSPVPESGFDQQVIGIERRNRKNSDSVFGKRMQK